jgi:hypothetical protein
LRSLGLNSAPTEPGVASAVDANGDPVKANKVDGPDNYKARWREDDGADRWRGQPNNKGSFIQGPNRYDPIERRQGAELKTELSAGVTLFKFGDTSSVDLYGDGNVVTLRSSWETKAEFKVDKEGYKAGASAYTYSELQLARNNFSVDGVGQGEVQVRSAVELGAKAEAQWTSKAKGFNAKFEAEAVLLQARGQFETRTLEPVDGVSVKVKGEGALNAGAIGGSLGAFAEAKEGKWSFGLSGSASALVGGKLGFGVEVDASRYLTRLWTSRPTTPVTPTQDLWLFP